MRRTATLAIQRTNAVRSSNPRIAPGREAGDAGAASNLITDWRSLISAGIPSYGTRAISRPPDIRGPYPLPAAGLVRAAGCCENGPRVN